MDAHIVLQMLDHASTAPGCAKPAGLPRLLNLAGRWATRGTAASPILTWPNLQQARDAAARCMAARQRPVQARQITGQVPGALLAFQPSRHEALLLGYEADEAVQGRQQSNDERKVLAYVSALMRADQAQGPQDIGIVERELRAAYPGSTLTAAAQFLTGARGRAAAGALIASGAEDSGQIAHARQIAERLMR